MRAKGVLHPLAVKAYRHDDQRPSAKPAVTGRKDVGKCHRATISKP
jgi:hypothetical protein